jgi:hypothetical protein
MAAGHLWQGRRPPHPSVSPPFLPWLLFKPSLSSRSPLCTRNTPTRSLEAPPSHNVASPSSPPPGKLVAGEGLPLLSLSSSLVFLPAFTEPTMPQVRALDAIALERCPTRRRRIPSPPPPLRLRNRLTSFHVVSKPPRSLFPFFLRTTVAPRARRRGRPAPFWRRPPWTPAPRP